MTPYYEKGGIALYSARWEEVLPTFPDGAFGLIFTSPPYNLGNSTGGGATYTGKGARFRLGYTDADRRMGNVGGAFTGKRPRASSNYGSGKNDDNLPHDEYRVWQQAFLRECWRLIRPEGAIYYNHKPRILGGIERWPTEFVPEGVPIRQTVIWHRDGGINVRPLWYVSAYEVVLILAGPAFRLIDHDASAVSDVWRLPRATENFGHPAPFPVGLPLTAIRTTGLAPVLDPHSGTGSTLISAKMCGIAAVGCEPNESYCEIIARRLEYGGAAAANPSQGVMSL